MPGITIASHGKVNLWLRVVGHRPDGYHEIETVLHEIDLADELSVEPYETVDVVIRARTHDEALPAPHESTVARAAAELAKLATLFGTPGGAILALPAAWRFFNLLLDELRAHQPASKEI